MRLPKGGKKSSADQQLPTSSTADLATLGPRRSGQCLRSPAPGCGPWICGQLRTVGKAHVPADSRKRINPERYVTSLGALVLRPRLLQGSPTSKNDECRTSFCTAPLVRPLLQPVKKVNGCILYHPGSKLSDDPASYQGAFPWIP